MLKSSFNFDHSRVTQSVNFSNFALQIQFKSSNQAILNFDLRVTQFPISTFQYQFPISTFGSIQFPISTFGSINFQFLTFGSINFQFRPLGHSILNFDLFESQQFRPFGQPILNFDRQVIQFRPSGHSISSNQFSNFQFRPLGQSISISNFNHFLLRETLFRESSRELVLFACYPIRSLSPFSGRV